LKIACRANPIQWGKYITSSTAIKMFNKGITSMPIDLRHQAYKNERKPNRAIFFNDGKKACAID